MGFVGGKNSTFFCSPFKVIFFNISFQFLLSVGKIQALLVFCLGYAFGKNQMCLNVRLAFYNEAQRSSISVVRDFDAIRCRSTAKFIRSKNAQLYSFNPHHAYTMLAIRASFLSLLKSMNTGI